MTSKHLPTCELKNVSLERAQDMLPEQRKEYGLPNKGLVVVETWVCDDNCPTLHKEVDKNDSN